MSMSTRSSNYARPSHLIALLTVAMTACSDIESDRDVARFGTGELLVIASARPVGDTSWTIRGRVLHSGTSVARASVYAIAIAENGQGHVSERVVSDTTGAFVIENVPMAVAYNQATDRIEVEIIASLMRDTASVVEGSSILILDPTRQKRWVPLPVGAVVVVPLIFLISIGIALYDVPKERPKLATLKYYSAVLLSLIFAFTMIGYISLGLRFVNSIDSTADVLSLGFANIYQANYVENMGGEWVFSLTSPPSLATKDQLDRGFGAPLWVILLAVVGSGLFIISLIVKQVKDPIGEHMKREVVRARVQEIVKHQFFILFAPLGAVIVYQLQVTVDAASSTITVALVALAAGVAVNVILERALGMVEALVKQGSNDNPGGETPTPPQNPAGPESS